MDYEDLDALVENPTELRDTAWAAIQVLQGEVAVLKDRAQIPQAWADLIEALTIMAPHHADAVSPLHCEQDKLLVLVEDGSLGEEKLDRLKALGFERNDGGGMYSFRFGSA
jgi:hypothetical protein